MHQHIEIKLSNLINKSKEKMFRYTNLDEISQYRYTFINNWYKNIMI